jgi:hypothetical protein
MATFYIWGGFPGASCFSDLVKICGFFVQKNGRKFGKVDTHRCKPVGIYYTKPDEQIRFDLPAWFIQYMNSSLSSYANSQSTPAMVFPGDALP